jgi:lipopolysaccharide transport system permease protein
MRRPLLLIRSMWSDLKASRELAWRLFVRDVSAQYRQSVLGIVWAFAPPIVTALVFMALQSRRVIDFGDINMPYPVYVLVGTIIWQLFSDSLNAPLKSVIAAKPMLVRINFPREALVLSAVYSVLFGLLIKLVLIVAILVVFQVHPTWTAVLALLPMLGVVLLGTCIGLLLTPFGMLYTDVSTALPIITQLLFFVTPVVYSPPTSFPFSLISVLNPVSPFLNASRTLLTQGSWAGPSAILPVSILVLVGLFVAFVIYRVALPILIERMSA